MSSSNKKNWTIIFGFFGLIIALFFPYEKPSVLKPKESASAPQDGARKNRGGDGTTKRGGEGAAGSAPSASGTAAIQRKRDEYNTIVGNRMKEVKTNDRGASISFDVRTHAEAKWCRSGDFDIIKSLVSDGRDKVFLLSVEPLHGAGIKTASTRLSLFEIMRGDRHEFTLPKSSSSQEYGVFLCLDPRKSNSCGRKPALSTKDWNAALGKTQLPENVLYFQLITTQSAKAYVIPVDKWSADDLNEMRGKLKTWLKTPEQSLATTGSILSKLGSLPADVENGVISIPLPYRDPRCDSKAGIKANGRIGGG